MLIAGASCASETYAGALALGAERLDSLVDLSIELPDSLGAIGEAIVPIDPRGTAVIVALRTPSPIPLVRIDGAHTIAMARRGHGPGEIVGPISLAVHADSLFALEAGRRLLTRFVNIGGIPRLVDQHPIPSVLTGALLLGTDGAVFAFDTRGGDGTLRWMLPSGHIASTASDHQWPRAVAPAELVQADSDLIVAYRRSDGCVFAFQLTFLESHRIGCVPRSIRSRLLSESRAALVKMSRLFKNPNGLGLPGSLRYSSPGHVILSVGVLASSAYNLDVARGELHPLQLLAAGQVVPADQLRVCGHGNGLTIVLAGSTVSRLVVKDPR